MAVVTVQGTVCRHDTHLGVGAVLLDDGAELGYSAEAFLAGGLRQLRVGQRVRLELETTSAGDPRDTDGRLTSPDVVVRRLTLLTLP